MRCTFFLRRVIMEVAIVVNEIRYSNAARNSIFKMSPKMQVRIILAIEMVIYEHKN